MNALKNGENLELMFITPFAGNVALMCLLNRRVNPYPFTKIAGYGFFF